MIETKVKLKPVGNRVVAKRTEAKEALKGGILLPDSAKEKQETATVIAVSDNKTVKVGDTILMDKYAGQEVTVDGDEFIIVKIDDIVAIVEE
ncbi:MAG: co-chaperone GroES [Simkaniaceae bacterium]|nr:co-chaperone GroES [Simkaniaceae bacterium]